MRQVTEIQTLLQKAKPLEINEGTPVSSTTFAQVPEAQVKATSYGTSVLASNLAKSNRSLLCY